MADDPVTRNDAGAGDRLYRRIPGFHWRQARMAAVLAVVLFGLFVWRIWE